MDGTLNVLQAARQFGVDRVVRIAEKPTARWLAVEKDRLDVGRHQELRRARGEEPTR